MKFAILGVLVVLLIGFFVVVWKAARDWRWYHIVSVIFIMLLAVTLIFPTAGVLKSRAAWHQLKEDLEERVETITEEQQLLKYGELSDPDAEGIVQLTQQLSALGMEAGRRWRDLRVANMAGGNITLVETGDPQAAPGLEVDGDAAAVPAEPMIPESMVVYGFAESPESVDSMNPEIKMPIPTRYLGEFVVVASAHHSSHDSTAGKIGHRPGTTAAGPELVAVRNAATRRAQALHLQRQCSHG